MKNKKLLIFAILLTGCLNLSSQCCKVQGTYLNETFLSSWNFADLGDGLNNNMTYGTCITNTTENGGITTNTGVLKFNQMRNGRHIGVRKTLPAGGLNNTVWSTDFKFTIIPTPTGGYLATNNANLFPLYFSNTISGLISSYADPNVSVPCNTYYAEPYGHAIGVRISSPSPVSCGNNAPNGTWSFRGFSKYFSTFTFSAPIPLTTSVIYFIRLERVSATSGRISVFSDDCYTNHLSGSPQSFSINSNIVSLAHMQSQSGTGNSTKDIFNGEISDLKIDDGINPLGAITSDFSAPTTVCFGTPINVNGNLSTGPVTNYFWEIAECDVNGNYTDPTAVWNNWYVGFPGAFTFPSLPFLQCNKYYKIKLAVQNNCTNWVETSKIFFMECSPPVDAGVDQTICTTPNGSGSFIIGGVNAPNPNYTYSWTPPYFLSSTNVSNPTVNYCIGNLVGCIHTGACDHSGTYHLTVTDTRNGCSSHDDATVNFIWQAPQGLTISKDRPEGWCSDEITLTANYDCEEYNDVTFYWPHSGETTQSVVVNPTMQTQYQVVATNQCYSTTASITIDPAHVLSGPFPTLEGNAFMSHISAPLVIFDELLWTPNLPYAYNAYEYQFTVWSVNGENEVVYTHSDIVPANSTGFWNGEITWDGTMNPNDLPNYNGDLVPVGAYMYGLRLRNCDNQDKCPPFDEHWFNPTGWDDCDVFITTDQDPIGDRRPTVVFLGPNSMHAGNPEVVNLSVKNNRTTINESIYNRVSISPNPNNGEFTISIQSAINANPNLYIVDISGRIVHTRSISIQEGFTEMRMSKMELPSGIYFIKVDGFDEPIKMIITK